MRHMFHVEHIAAWGRGAGKALSATTARLYGQRRRIAHGGWQARPGPSSRGCRGTVDPVARGLRESTNAQTTGDQTVSHPVVQSGRTQ